MRVWEKIQDFQDNKNMTKEQIENECCKYKICPSDIESTYDFIGNYRMTWLCNKHKCGHGCVKEYLEIDAR